MRIGRKDRRLHQPERAPDTKKTCARRELAAKIAG